MFYTKFWKEHQSLSICNRVRETCSELALTYKAFLILFYWTDPVPVMLSFIFYLKHATTDTVPNVTDTIMTWGFQNNFSTDSNMECQAISLGTVTDVSKDHSLFIFRVKQSKKSAWQTYLCKVAKEALKTAQPVKWLAMGRTVWSLNPNRDKRFSHLQTIQTVSRAHGKYKATYYKLLKYNFKEVSKLPSLAW